MTEVSPIQALCFVWLACLGALGSCGTSSLVNFPRELCLWLVLLGSYLIQSAIWLISLASVSARDTSCVNHCRARPEGDAILGPSTQKIQLRSTLPPPQPKPGETGQHSFQILSTNVEFHHTFNQEPSRQFGIVLAELQPIQKPRRSRVKVEKVRAEVPTAATMAPSRSRGSGNDTDASMPDAPEPSHRPSDYMVSSHLFRSAEVMLAGHASNMLLGSLY